MTDPLSRNWKQPDSSNMLFDDRFVVMTEETFKKLKEYSCSIPSGKYQGKMWKCNSNWGTDDFSCWVLKWYEDHETSSNLLHIRSRYILVV